MTAYDTTALATAIIGEDAVTANRKAATRTLRKFLRTDFAAREQATPGKGGRYSIELNKRELNAMTKRFKGWQEQQEKEAQARREALAAAKAPAKPAAIESTDEAETASDEAIELDSSDEAEGPSDEELAEMLSEIEDEASSDEDDDA